MIVSRPKVYFGNGGANGIAVMPRVETVRAGRGMFPQKKPLVYGGGGVSPGKVLAAGGIASGTIVKVGDGERRRVLKEVKMVGREARTIEAGEKKVQPQGLTELEKAAVEFFERVEKERSAEAIPKEEKPLEVEKAKETKVETAELPKVETVTTAVFPELSLGEVAVGKRKRRGRRKHRHGNGGGEMSEERRAELQAEIDAASDAATSNE